MSTGDLRDLTAVLVRPIAGMSIGQSPLLTIHAKGLTKLLEPASAVYGKVIGEWAGAVWSGWPLFAILDAALRQARK